MTAFAKTAFEPLTVAEQELAAVSTPKSPEKKPLIPVPADAAAFNFRHPVYGEPSGCWPYHQADGALVGYAARFEYEENGQRQKTVLPVTYCEVQDGERTYRAWRSCGVPAPRPLYRLPQLIAPPDARILVVEGEKTADSAAELFPDLRVTSSMGGAKAAAKSDFTPLAGRRVVIWPDNDDAGERYAAEVAVLALGAGAMSVAIVQVPAGFPPKWDLADPMPSGVIEQDLRQLLDAADPVNVADVNVGSEVTTLPPGYTMIDRGLVWCDPADDGKPEMLLAGVFEVLAETRDADGKSWGVLLTWRDHDGRKHEHSLPRSALAGDGVDARKVLLDGGLYVAPSRKARDLLTAFLASVRAPSRARATNRIGWHDSAFVLPDQSFGCAPGDRLVLQGNGAVEHSFAVKGSLVGWNDDIARLAKGNSRLILAISTALASPLIGPCSMESGGLHFKGASSTGKTTVLTVAGSVWGGGEPSGYVKSWRSTANGLEGVALGHCDALLCLDELSQLPAKDAAEVAYMLANGSGKSRATRDGSARRAPRWRVLFLSSGEIGLADKVAEEGPRRRSTAGQQVRIVDVPADAGAGLGIFDNLHEFPSADALARHLRKAALTTYGAPIRAFLGKIAEDTDNVRKAVADHIEEFVAAHVPHGADGQVHRVAQRFGLIAAGGELAVSAGVITVWAPGDAIGAAALCFKEWLAARGGVEPSEARDGIAQVRSFISANGEARFVPAWDTPEVDRFPVRDVAGYRKRADDGWDYYVTATAWKDEVCRGFDHTALAAAMVERRLMECGADGRASDSVRVPGQGRHRLYHLSARLLAEEPS